MPTTKAKDKSKPLKLTVRVTRADIEKGWNYRVSDPYRCPVGLALKRACGRGGKYVYGGHYGARVSGYEETPFTKAQLKPYRAMQYAHTLKQARTFTLKLTFRPEQDLVEN